MILDVYNDLANIIPPSQTRRFTLAYIPNVWISYTTIAEAAVSDRRRKKDKVSDRTSASTLRRRPNPPTGIPPDTHTHRPTATERSQTGEGTDGAPLRDALSFRAD